MPQPERTRGKVQSSVPLQMGRLQELTFGVDSGDALGGADVPDADGFVP